MRLYLFMLIGLMLPQMVVSQVIKFSDETNLQAVEGVVVVINDEDPNSSIHKSNSKGIYQLTTLNADDTLRFFHPYYETMHIAYREIMGKSFYEVFLKEKVNEFEEVVAAASKFNEKKKDVSQHIDVINTAEIQHLNQSSTADLLSQSGSVFVQKSQQGGGSPIVRGFEANKVLLVVDGVRMNNAIYRGGHLQNVITLDNAIMEKVEVLFGPGSVVYGSDALGGVMHFYTKKPNLADSGMVYRSNAYARYFSAASGYALHGDVSIGSEKFGSLTSVTMSTFDDLRQGRVRNPFYSDFGKRNWYVKRIGGKDTILNNQDFNLQRGSAYQQYDFLQKFLYKVDQDREHQLNIQISTSSDVPRYDRLTQLKDGLPRYAEWYYGPQNRFLASYRFVNKKKKRLYDEFHWGINYQNIEESRNTRNFQVDELKKKIETLNIVGANADFAKEINRHELRYGVDVNYNDVQSKGIQKNILSGVESPGETRYPDAGSYMYTLAAYLTHTFEISEKWILNDGFRVTKVGLESRFTGNNFNNFPFTLIEQENAAINGSLGLIYMPIASWRISLFGTSGFRAPNVDDVGKIFDSEPGYIIVPNANLKPEYTYSGEIGVSKRFWDQISLSGVFFYTHYDNALQLRNSTLNGQDSILFDGIMSQVVASTNTGSAYLYGTEFNLKGKLNEHFSVYGSLTYTYGRVRTDSTDTPLGHVPPTFGKIGLRVLAKRTKMDVYSMFSGWKRLEDYASSGEDNFSNATINGMPAWHNLNARVSYQFSKILSLQIACENIFDVNYRVFASNISAPGRNFVFTLRSFL